MWAQPGPAQHWHCPGSTWPEAGLAQNARCLIPAKELLCHCSGRQESSWKEQKEQNFLAADLESQGKTPKANTFSSVHGAVLKDLLLLGAGGSRAVTHVVSNGPAQLVHPGPGLCNLLGCTDHIWRVLQRTFPPAKQSTRSLLAPGNHSSEFCVPFLILSHTVLTVSHLLLTHRAGGGWSSHYSTFIFKSYPLSALPHI